ncbi:recombinase family protein [Streptomyces sp. Qhu-G9]|uniref:recombinase family protein n=1 Tax=Streptomyces sp. Qhu-G9 TaxID=3452799 RepID=UPI0022ABD15D|nr:recombinase family protein [Streptomyces aurantiacus]WAU82127.1 recombinase family protein [Streptomyces aurantiacus]
MIRRTVPSRQSSRSSTASHAWYPTPATSATPSPPAASSSRSAALSTTPPTRWEDVFNILATFAEFEVDLLRMRTREGTAVARAKGKLSGKQPKITTCQQTHMVQQHQSGEHTIADLVELFSVSRATDYHVLERHQNAAAPSTSGGL